MTLPIPTEAAEQMALVRWLRVNGYKFFRVPNETYTKSIRQKSINTALGVVSGVPDLFVISKGQLIGIEMKRLKGGTVTPDQKEWIETLNAAGVPTKVCRGRDDAIEFIENFHTANS